jgi:hypothetical protein
MAGSDPTTVTDIPLIDVDTLLHKIDSQQDLLRDILDTLRQANRARTIVSLSSVGAAVTNVYSDHVRLFVERINVTATGGIFIAQLNVGSRTYRWVHTNSQPRGTEFPIVIDRGTDVSVSWFDVAGAPVSPAFAYVHIIGTVE